MRQTRFASVMYHAGWTNKRFPIEASSTIADSISRYEGFLKLVADSDTSMGPTKEIDLVWHTHQLTAGYRYFLFINIRIRFGRFWLISSYLFFRTDCIRLLGFFMNHIDDDPRETLSVFGPFV